jgi:hypothetical protein
MAAKDNEIQVAEAQAPQMPAVFQDMTLEKIQTIAALMVGSGGFGKVSGNKDLAAVKILVGQELGIGPFAALQGINIIQGNPVVAGNIYASKVKSNPKYDYRVVTWDEKHCKLQFFQSDGKKMSPASEDGGYYEFTLEDARAQGLLGKPNWKSMPKTMLFNRAISGGAKVYTPDIFNSVAVYAEGEIDDAAVVVEPQAPQTAPEPATVAKDAPVEGEIVDAPQSSGPSELEKFSSLDLPHQLAELMKKVKAKCPEADDKDKILMVLNGLAGVTDITQGANAETFAKLYQEVEKTAGEAMSFFLPAPPKKEADVTPTPEDITSVNLDDIPFE